jgi:hypothetical protein
MDQSTSSARHHGGPFAYEARRMAIVAKSSTSDTLQRLAGDLHNVAFDYMEPARSIDAAEQRIAEVERICDAARQAVRG